MKSNSSTVELPSKLSFLRLEEENGTAGVKVKFVDIGRNACGEDGSLVYT